MKAVPVRLVACSIGAVLSLASVSVIIKLIQADPWTIAVARLSLGALCIGLYGWWRREFRRLRLEQVVALALMGLCFGAHWISFFYSIKLSSPSLALVALSAYGPFVVIWGRVFLGEPVHAKDGMAIALSLFGTLLCVPKFSFGDGSTAGFLIGIASGILYALLPILQKRTAAYPVTMKAFGQFFFALLAMLPFLGYSDWHLGRQDWFGLLFLGIVGTFVAHTLWVHVTTQLSPPMAGALFYAQIPVAMLMSALVLGERLHWKVLVGLLFIICGNFLSIVCRLADRTRALA